MCVRLLRIGLARAQFLHMKAFLYKFTFEVFLADEFKGDDAVLLRYGEKANLP